MHPVTVGLRYYQILSDRHEVLSDRHAKCKKNIQIRLLNTKLYPNAHFQQNSVNDVRIKITLSLVSLPELNLP